jgi:hypothetical protein
MNPVERPLVITGKETLEKILGGRKIQIRFALNKQPPEWATSPESNVGPWVTFLGVHPEGKCGHSGCGCKEIPFDRPSKAMWTPKCPYGAPGDILWVKEPWKTRGDLDSIVASKIDSDNIIEYLASGPSFDEGLSGKNRSAYHMPKWASRLFLEITGLKVQKLNEMTLDEEIFEGSVTILDNYPHQHVNYLWMENLKNRKFPWKSNPWVWVISFKILFEKSKLTTLQQQEAISTACLYSGISEGEFNVSKV